MTSTHPQSTLTLPASTHTIDRLSMRFNYITNTNNNIHNNISHNHSTRFIRMKYSFFMATMRNDSSGYVSSFRLLMCHTHTHTHLTNDLRSRDRENDHSQRAKVACEPTSMQCHHDPQSLLQTNGNCDGVQVLARICTLDIF